MKYLFFSLILFFATFSAHASENETCTIEMQNELWHIIPKIRSWEKMYEVYSKYGVCDDGWMAEGFSDKITKLLALQWGSLADCHKFTQLDSSFEEFVLNHIDPTCDTDILKNIETNSEKNCKNDLTLLCDEIRIRASSSIKIIEAMP